MTSAPSNNKRSSLHRPYWLVLVLALFLAGQVAGSAHWHETSKSLDADCALCLLSNANGAAAIASAWQPLTIPLSGVVCLLLAVLARRSAVRFFDSRAPPSLRVTTFN